MLSGLFFFFKQKTAYEMRISDWSSDVCSSDLDVAAGQPARITAAIEPLVMVEGHGGCCIEPGMSQPGQQVVAAAGMAFHQPDFRLIQPAGLEQHRSEERRGGTECVRTCRSRWSPEHSKKKTTTT